MGKKILEIVAMLASKYENATFGLIIGALLTFLIGSVPFLGGPLSAFLGPLLMFFGMGKGFMEDLRKDSPQLAVAITEAGTIFQPLNPQTA